MDIQPVFISVGAALIYSLLWYCRQYIDPDTPTLGYDIYKLGGTLILGACIGIGSIVTGVELTQGSIEDQLLAYGFVITTVEQLGKALYRSFVQGFEGVA